MVYGRRIVRKTFLTRGCVRHDAYFSITSTGKAVSEGVIYGVGEANYARAYAGRSSCNRRIPEVPPDYYDVLAAVAPVGVLIAAGTSYGVVRKVFDKSSPLLGHMLPMKIDILAYEDVLAQVADPVLAMLYRDPWVIPLTASYREFVEKFPQLALVARGSWGRYLAKRGEN